MKHLLIRAYWWLVVHEICPRRVGLGRLCGRIEDVVIRWEWRG